MKQPTGLFTLWAIPRSRSTSFFRMMLERGDCLCIHEPFCAIADDGYVDLPDGHGHQLTLESKEEVAAHILSLSAQQRIFLKETTDHDHSDLLHTGLFNEQVKTAILIREPEEAIASHLRMNPGVDQASMGFGHLLKLVKSMQSSGHHYHLIKASDLVKKTTETVQNYCTFSQLPFIPEALNWTSENRHEWSRTQHWHSDVAESTGIQQLTMNKSPLSPELQDMLEKHLSKTIPEYNALLEIC